MGMLMLVSEKRTVEGDTGGGVVTEVEGGATQESAQTYRMS